MDVKPNENSPKVGDTYLSLDEKTAAVFYTVEGLDGGEKGTWIQLSGIQFADKIYIPLLFLDKSFVKVNETTVQTLFGKGDKNGTTNNDQKG